jgi:hypothetical protein
MKMKRHCNLCEHQKLSLQKGDLCGLTNKKPDFNRTCVRINFDEKLLNTLEDILIEYEDLKLSKKKVYKNFISGSIIGVFLLLVGYFVFDYFLNNGFRTSLKSAEYTTTVSFIILVTGYSYLTKSINNINNHKTQLNFIKNKKKEIDEVLNLYNQKYTSKIKFDKEIHGIQEVEVDIELI